MLNIDLGSGGGDGLAGPFIEYKAKVTDAAPARSWMLREKPDGADSYQVTNITEAFGRGVVIDMESVKLGWEKAGPKGQAPERVWAPAPNLSTFPRPTDEKRQGDDGKYRPVWSEVFAVRVAIGGGVAGTWTQCQFAAFKAFGQLVGLYQQQGPANPGKLMTVRVADHISEYNTNRPVFAVVGWVDRPACLNVAVAPIDTGAAAAPAAPAQPAPAPAAAAPAPQAVPAPAAGVPDALAF